MPLRRGAGENLAEGGEVLVEKLGFLSQLIRVSIGGHEAQVAFAEAGLAFVVEFEMRHGPYGWRWLLQ